MNKETVVHLHEADRSARDTLLVSDAAITALLAPKRGIAFVGSAKITDQVRSQFARYGAVKICLVNPRGGGDEEFPCYASVCDVPDEIELVVIKTRPAAVPGIIDDCGARGIRHALVFSDGFGETGEDGAALEAELAVAIARSGVRVIGPNTNDNAFEAYPLPEHHRGRRIALITQSGANGRSVVEGVAMGAAFERWVTTGNETDLEVADFVHYFAGIDDVGVIALYVEGFKDAAKLRVALERALLAGKPVVAIKMGSTKRGAIAAASHTGHLTGADDVVNGIFKRYGVTRVSDLDELLETANLFSKLPQEAGTRCAALTISGGTSALIAEAADTFGIELPLFDQALQNKLHEYIQPNLNVANPVDTGGVFNITSDQARRLEVMDLVADAPGVDLLVMGFNAAYGALSDGMGSDVLAWAPTRRKPLVAIWASVQIDTPGYRDLVASGAIIFRSFQKCMRALAQWNTFQARRRRFDSIEIEARALSATQSRALEVAGVLKADRAAALLRASGIEMPREVIARTNQELSKLAEEIGFPLVMKLVSPNFPHKTEIGLVRLDIRDAREARLIGDELFARAKELDPSAPIDGVLLQEQIPQGVEVIVGLSQDRQFGATLTLGAGGIYAELLNDVAIAPLPLSELDVRDMLASLKLAPLLDGYRGAPPADREALVRLIMRVVALGEAAGPRLAELDLNPVVVLPERAIAVDSLVVASGPPGEQCCATRP